MLGTLSGVQGRLVGVRDDRVGAEGQREGFALALPGPWTNVSFALRTPRSNMPNPRYGTARTTLDGLDTGAPPSRKRRPARAATLSSNAPSHPADAIFTAREQRRNVIDRLCPDSQSYPCPMTTGRESGAGSDAYESIRE